MATPETFIASGPRTVIEPYQSKRRCRQAIVFCLNNPAFFTLVKVVASEGVRTEGVDGLMKSGKRALNRRKKIGNLYQLRAIHFAGLDEFDRNKKQHLTQRLVLLALSLVEVSLVEICGDLY